MAGPAASRRSPRRISRERGPWTARLWIWSVAGLTWALRPELRACSLSQIAAIVVAADPAELVGAVAEQGAVVDHAAVLVAHRRVDHLPDREPADVAGQRALQERLGVGAQHLELAQGREVDRDAALAAGPVFLDRPCLGEAVGQPVAAILGQVAGECRDPAVEAGLLGELQGCVRRHAIAHRALEQVGLGIDPDVDVGQDPAVGGVDVARAGRGGADQVGRRAQQHVVAGARPGLVEVDGALRVDHGVEEQVDRRPALLRPAGRARRAWPVKLSEQLAWPK